MPSETGVQGSADTQPTHTSTTRQAPASSSRFIQPPEHPTIPSHFGRPPLTQPPKASSSTSHAKRAKHRVVNQHFSTEKRKKNPNPAAAAFERSQEIASGEAQPGDGFLQGTIGKWESLKRRGNICLLGTKLCVERSLTRSLQYPGDLIPRASGGRHDPLGWICCSWKLLGGRL